MRAVLRSLAPRPGPARPLAVVTLLQAFGLGLLITITAIFFTQHVGLSAAELGFGLTLAGVLGLIVAVPVGHLSDRRSPRILLFVLMLLISLSVLGFLAVGSFLVFVLIMAAYRLGDRAAGAVRGGLIARAVAADDHVEVRNYLRVISNIGTSSGVLVAAWALTVNEVWAYQVLIVSASVLCACAALGVLAVPSVAPVPKERQLPGWTVLLDRRYLSFCALNAVLAFHYAVLEVGVPLWLAQQPGIPMWLVTAIFIINTVLVIVFQVSLGRRASTSQSAARVTVVAGGLLAVACVLFGVSSHLWLAVAVGSIVIAAVLHAFGEILQVAASWSLSFELANPGAYGQYQGLFNTSTTGGLTLGASVVAIVAVEGGTVGWFVLAGFFLLSGALMPLVLRVGTRRASE